MIDELGKQLALTTMSTKVNVRRIRFFEPDNLLLYHCMVYDEVNNRIAILKKYSSLKASERSISSDVIELVQCNEYEFPNVYQQINENDTEPNNLETITWGPEDNLFSAGMTGTINQYDLTRNLISKTYRVGGGPIWSMSYQAQSKKIAVATEIGFLKVYSWDYTNNSLDFGTNIGKFEDRLLSVVWSDEDTIITGSISYIIIWSASKKKCLEKLLVGQGIIVWTLASFDGKIISGDSQGQTSFWSVEDRCKITSVQSHEKDVLSVAVSKSGVVASSGVDQLMVLFDINLNIPTKLVHFKLHTHDVKCMTFGPGDVLFSGGLDSFLGLTKTKLKKRKKSSSLHFTNLKKYVHVNGKQVLFQKKKSVTIYSLEESNPVKTEEIFSKYNILSVAFSDSWIIYSTKKSLVILARESNIHGDQVMKKVSHDFTEAPLSIDLLKIVDSSTLAISCDKWCFLLKFQSNFFKCQNPLEFENRITCITTNSTGAILVTLINRDVYHFSPSLGSFSPVCELPTSSFNCVHDPIEHNIFWYLMSNSTLAKVNIESKKITTIRFDQSSVDFVKCRNILSTGEAILIYSDDRIFSLSASDGTYRNCISDYKHIVSVELAENNSNRDPCLVVVELPPETLFNLLPTSYERTIGSIK